MAALTKRPIRLTFDAWTTVVQELQAIRDSIDTNKWWQDEEVGRVNSTLAYLRRIWEDHSDGR